MSAVLVDNKAGILAEEQSDFLSYCYGFLSSGFHEQVVISAVISVVI